MSQEMLIQLIGFAGVGAGLYAAIRADLVRALVTAEHAALEASEAHKRIDKFIERRGNNA